MADEYAQKLKWQSYSGASAVVRTGGDNAADRAALLRAVSESADIFNKIVGGNKQSLFSASPSSSQSSATAEGAEFLSRFQETLRQIDSTPVPTPSVAQAQAVEPSEAPTSTFGSSR